MTRVRRQISLLGRLIMLFVRPVILLESWQKVIE